ncbi:regulator of nonsense transcripts UPF3-like [Quillaja saponaria]|uniref:Regulator of nonsense transcripts UPF3-like n=1 Tax=Quillaja saponaria TaxID=32244 RepID=A0AAD7M107_QUISA|nr:regulator of nonsense transcripts UPF3-like [Quillaja saponaria]
MKGTLNRTKVVLRHLPPAISKATLLDIIDGSFAGRYKWVSFRPGKNSQKNLSYSRAYIDFKRTADVIEFAQFFDGHVFVNEKGTQFKTIVEYAPSQRVPRPWSKTDGREGTIHKDSEYLEFLELLAKPVENLPSAEIQLERREAERSAIAAKDIPIVTPLMDFVRQRRAAKGRSRRSLSNGKLSRRAGGSSSGSPSSTSSRRGAEKRRVSTRMYVIRDTANCATAKDKSTNVLVPKRDDQLLSGTETFEEESGVADISDAGKRKILLLKGKERDITNLSDDVSKPQTAASSAKTVLGSASSKQNQRYEGSGRIIKSILLNKDARQNQSSRVHSDEQIQISNLEKEKRPPRPLHVQLILKGANGALEDKVVAYELHGPSERQEKHKSHKDRPDRGVWTHRSKGLLAGVESSSTSAGQTPHIGSSEGSHAHKKIDMSNARNSELKAFGGGRGHSALDNGSHKHISRRGPAHGAKDVDGYLVSSEGKHSRRGGSSAYGSHEKQVWVQKASSG